MNKKEHIGAGSILEGSIEKLCGDYASSDSEQRGLKGQQGARSAL